MRNARLYHGKRSLENFMSKISSHYIFLQRMKSKVQTWEWNRCCDLTMSCPSSLLPVNSWYVVDPDIGLTFSGGGFYPKLAEKHVETKPE